MVTWNTGSVSSYVGNLIGWANLSNISGTTLDNIVVQSINYVSQYTTDIIDPNSIAEKYQPVISKLAQADCLIAIQAQHGGITSVRVGGDLEVSQSAGGNLDLAKQLKDEAILRLKELQRHVRFKRVLA